MLCCRMCVHEGKQETNGVCVNQLPYCIVHANDTAVEPGLYESNLLPEHAREQMSCNWKQTLMIAKQL